MPTTQVILTRHAEKGPGDDPPLIEAGRRRATQLGEILSHIDHPLSAVYTSNYRRTIETADLAIRAAGASVTPVREPAADAIARAILARTPAVDDVILVVHHSDTLGDIVRGLRSSLSPPAIGDGEFDHLWCVAIGARQGERFGRYPAAAATGGAAAAESAEEETAEETPEPTWDEVKQQVIAAVEACEECRSRTNTLAMKFSPVQAAGFAGSVRNFAFILVGMAQTAGKAVLTTAVPEAEWVFKKFDIPNFLDSSDPAVEKYVCTGIASETSRTIEQAKIPNVRASTESRSSPIDHTATRIDWTKPDGTVESWIFDWHARLDVSNPQISTLVEWKNED